MIYKFTVSQPDPPHKVVVKTVGEKGPCATHSEHNLSCMSMHISQYVYAFKTQTTNSSCSVRFTHKKVCIELQLQACLLALEKPQKRKCSKVMKKS